MSTVTNFFVESERPIGAGQSVFADTFNAEGIVSMIDNKDGVIVFNVSSTVKVTLLCKHTTINRRGKVVWYGEGDPFNFGFIVLGRDNGRVTDVYAELSHEGTCYFISALSTPHSAFSGVGKVVITEQERVYHVHDEPDERAMMAESRTHKSGVSGQDSAHSVRGSHVVPAWEAFDTNKVNEGGGTLKVLAVYSSVTSEEIQKTCLGKPYVRGKTTGHDMIACLAELAEDVTNIIFKNSRINTRVEIVLSEIADPGNLIGTQDPSRVKHILMGAHSAIEAKDENPRSLASRTFFNALTKRKQEMKAHVVCVFLGKKGVQSGLGVAVGVPGSLRELLDNHDELLDHCFISVLLADADTPAGNLNRATFTHELGHILGGEHPFVQLNNNKAEITVATASKDYYWMKGYHLLDPNYSTVMGYKRRIPYFSSADIHVSGNHGHPIGEAISGVTPTDMARGVRVTANALAQGYTYASAGAHIDINVVPMVAGRPLPGVVEQDILGDNKLKLTAVPFEGRALFSHWMVDDIVVERGKASIVINTTASRKVRACFSEEEKTHGVRFDAQSPVDNFLIFYELFNDKNALQVYERKISGHSDTTLTFPHGTDIELESLPNVSKEINSHIFFYTLDHVPFLSELPRFRVSKNHRVGIGHVKLDFHVERGDLGYMVCEQYGDNEPFYTIKSYTNAAPRWSIALRGRVLSNSDNENIHFLKRKLVPYLTPADADKSVDVVIRFEEGTPPPVINKVTVECDATVGRILLGKEEVLDVREVSYSAFPSVSSMTVANGTTLHARVLLSEAAKKAGYKVKSWSHSPATEDKATFKIASDMTIRVAFTK